MTYASATPAANRVSKALASGLLDMHWLASGLTVGAMIYCASTGAQGPSALALGTAGQVLTAGASAPQWSSALALTGTIASKQVAAAGISLDHNSATGNFTLRMSPANLTASRRWSFPDRDDTAAGLGAQTFAGLQTVTGGLTITTAALTITDVNVVLSATTGTKFGTATTQKLAFFNSTPIVKPTGDVITALGNLGLVGSATVSATALTGIVPSANGGTGVNNAGTITNASNTTITGGGTVALGGFTLTVPATGTAALLAASNAHTGADTFTNAAGIIVRPAATQDGIQLLGRAGGTSSFKQIIATAALGADRTLTLPDADLAVTGGGTLALGGFTLTAPATGTAALLATAQTFTALQTIDLGTGAHPSGAVKGAQLRMQGADAGNTSFGALCYGSINGFLMQAVTIGGTRASPSATVSGANFTQLLGYGYANGVVTSAKIGYQQLAGVLWTASDNETYHLFSGVASGTTTFTNWLWLRGGASEPSALGALGIGAAPTTGNGLLQLASGTTKASGWALGPDVFGFRTGTTAMTLDAATAVTFTGNGIFNGITTATSCVQLTATATLGASPADAYLAGASFAPTYNGAFTVTRHNYLQILQPAGAATITDACVFRFDAAIGTHKAVDAATTKTSPGTVTAWVKININGTVHYVPAYASKTS